MKFMTTVSLTTAAAPRLPMFLLGLLAAVVVAAVGDAVAAAAVVLSESGTCQPINIDLCKDLPYNETRFPNMVGDESQRDAEAALATFDPLIHVYCSSQLKFFLCSVYVPMCTEKVPIAIGPCRPLCEHVRTRCEPLLKEFGFPWPLSMNCSKFPQENNNEAMCMKGPPVGDHPDGPPVDPPSTQSPRSSVACPQQTSVYVNRTSECVLLCSSTAMYHAEEQQLAATLLVTLSSVTLLLGVVSAVMFLCRPRHTVIGHPGLALFFSLFCSVVSSVVILFAVHERTLVSCVRYTTQSVLVSPGTMAHIPCTIVGILLYYFGTASRLWLLLCASSGERRFAVHVLAWAIPMAAVIVVLMAQAVHGDQLTGLCLVGAQSPASLRAFVAVRELLLVMVGGAALLFGFVGLRRRGLRGDDPMSASRLTTGVLALCYLPLGAAQCYCFFMQAASESEGKQTSFSAAMFRIGLDVGSSTVLAGLCSVSWMMCSAVRASKAQLPEKTAASAAAVRAVPPSYPGYTPSLPPTRDCTPTTPYSTQSTRHYPFQHQHHQL